MLSIITFIPKVLILGVTMGSVNFFKKKRTAALPEHIFYTTLAPAFGIDMKPLIKGIESVLGKDLENTLTDIDGFHPGRSIGLGKPSFTDVEGFIEDSQGIREEGANEGFFHRRARLQTTGMLVSEETLNELMKSKFFCVYSHEDYTANIYDCHRRWKNEKFIGAATQYLIATGELETVCYECESDCGIDSDGDCENCDTERVSEELLNKTVKQLQKEAA